MHQKEYRVVKAEIKAAGQEANIGKISGYGSVFGVQDSYDDIVEHGSFSESITKYMPKMLLQHKWEDIGGVWKTAREDSRGLYLEGEINLDVQKAAEYYSLIKQGAIDGLSIGFMIEDSERNQKTGVRHIKQVKLMEVSIVTFPANVEAYIREVRSRNDIDLPKTEREFENFLRDAGFGTTQAKTIVSKGFKELIKMQRDVDDDSEMKAALQQLANTLGVSHAGNRSKTTY